MFRFGFARLNSGPQSNQIYSLCLCTAQWEENSQPFLILADRWVNVCFSISPSLCLFFFFLMLLEMEARLVFFTSIAPGSEHISLSPNYYSFGNDSCQNSCNYKVKRTLPGSTEWFFLFGEMFLYLWLCGLYLKTKKIRIIISLYWRGLYHSVSISYVIFVFIFPS